MEDQLVMKMIWCEECSCGAWRHVSGLMWKGAIVTRSGPLRVPAECHACEDWLAVGERVEAVALNVPEPESSEWLRHHVRADEPAREGTIKKQEVG